MAASDNLGPQFSGPRDELAAARTKRFNAILDQVPTFDEEIAESNPPKPPTRSPRRRLRAVK